MGHAQPAHADSESPWHWHATGPGQPFKLAGVPLGGTARQRASATASGAECLAAGMGQDSEPLQVLAGAMNRQPASEAPNRNQTPDSCFLPESLIVGTLAGGASHK